MPFKFGKWLNGGLAEASSSGAAARTATLQASKLAALERVFAIIELQADGTILHASEGFLSIVGYTLPELVGKPYAMLIDPSLRDSLEYRQWWAKALLGHADRQPCRLSGKGGKEIWVEASCASVQTGSTGDSAGQLPRVILGATDITALKQVQKDDAARFASAQTGNAELAARFADHTGAFQATEVELRAMVTAVIDGNMQARMNLAGQPPFFEMLSQQINSLVDSFAGVVGSVKSTASEVARGVQEISQGNVDLSERTEAQASSLEQTASSMEQMTSSVRQNADNSRQANQLAVAARDQADKGGAVVAKAVKAMSEINASSKKIADIIGVIDEIAFQTNLLALNAAVEAARAGEQGRGFAVVASEVRNLAGRSALAAKEIKGLISDSVHKVEEGSSLVAQSGQTLEQIVSAVKKVSDIIAEIAASSQEQSTGIDQVNKAVVQLDEMTQQNAALVEQATAASQSIAEQSQALSDVMSKYHVAASSARPEIPRAPRESVRAERRTASRPWSAPKGATAAPVTPAAPRTKRAKTGTSDSDWAQF